MDRAREAPDDDRGRAPSFDALDADADARDATRDGANDVEWRTVNGRKNAKSSRERLARSSSSQSRAEEIADASVARVNAYEAIAPPGTPTRSEREGEGEGTEGRDARRRAKRRARRGTRRTSAALRVLGGASTGASEDEYYGEGADGGWGIGGIAARAAALAAATARARFDTAREATTTPDSDAAGRGKEEGEVVPLMMRTFPPIGGSRPPLPGRATVRAPMSPPRPRPPKTPKTPKSPTTLERTKSGRHGGDGEEREHQNALDWFFHQMDLAFAGVMLAVYAFYDTVMKFIGIKVLRVSQSSRSVRQTEARVAEERAAVEEFEEILSARQTATEASSRSPSASDVDGANRTSRPRTPPSASTSATTSKHATIPSVEQRVVEEREEGELTPSHALRRRLSSSLGGAWGGGGNTPPSFRVARVDEDATHAHNELVSCVGSRGDEYITGGWDGTLRTWKWDPTKGLSGGLPMTGQHNDNVEFLSVDAREDHERLAISGGRDCTVRIWDVAKRSQRSRIYAFENIASGCVDWESQTVAVGSRGGAVMLWDAEKGSKKCTLRGHDGEVTSMCTYDWSEGGATLYVSGGADGTVRVWDARQHVAVATMTEHRRRVYAVCPGPKGIIFAGDFSSNVKVHSLSNPGALPRLLPNVPSMDGCEAPIAGLQYVKLDGMNGGGLLLSTAAYFPLNENGEESDDDDAPQGCVHVRAVDATGAGVGPVSDQDGDGYMYTLKGIEGLLTCASLTATSDGHRMRLVVGAGSGALGAYAEGGALSGQTADDAYASTIERADDLGVESFD